MRRALTASATARLCRRITSCSACRSPPGRDAEHEPALGGHERHLLVDVAPDHVLPHLEPGRDVGGEHQDRVGGEERLGKREPAVGAVVERALQPLGGGGVGAVGLERDDEPRERADPLGAHRVPLVRHGAGADLLRLERLEQLALVLQQAEVAGHLRRRLRDAAQGVEDLAVDLARVGLAGHGERVARTPASR